MAEEMFNPLGGMPAAQPEAQEVAPGGQQPAPPRMESLEDYGVAYEKLQQAKGTLDEVGKALESLVALRDTVTGEDVVEAAGTLVAQGLDPMELAGLLAEMPENGEMLVEWLGGMAQQMGEREAQLDEVMSQVRMGMGVLGVRQLMDEDLEMKGALRNG